MLCKKRIKSSKEIVYLFPIIERDGSAVSILKVRASFDIFEAIFRQLFLPFGLKSQKLGSFIEFHRAEAGEHESGGRWRGLSFYGLKLTDISSGYFGSCLIFGFGRLLFACEVQKNGSGLASEANLHHQE